MRRPRSARRPAARKGTPPARVGPVVDRGVRARLALLAAAVAAAAIAASRPARAGGPFAKGPFLQALGSRAVTIKVETEEPQRPVVEIVELAAPGARDDAGQGATASARREIEAASPRRLSAVRIEGLEPARSYEYRVRVGDAASEAGRFTTAPEDDRPFRFLVYGDSRSAPGSHAAVVRALEGTPSDLLIHTGDMVGTGGDEDEWQGFFRVEGPLLRDRCLFAAVGNHELVKADPHGDMPFLRYFAAAEADGRERPHLYGSFRWSNTRFFLLNAMDEWTGAERAWLAGELARAADERGLVHRIAVLHHGPFSSGPHGANGRLASGDVLSILRNGRVDLVLAGHDHVYERGEGAGLKYLVSGGAGAPLYERKRQAPETQLFEAVHHFLEVAIDGPEVDVVARRATGSVIERCRFSSAAPGPWACEGGGAKPVATAAPGLTSPASGSRACLCEAAGGARGGGAAWVSSLALAAVVCTRRIMGLIARRRGGYPRAMRRLANVLSLLSLAAALAGGCATYSQDLDRAHRHYDANQFEQALALFRVLEPDMDSFSAAERAQYAYLRGMTDYRLAGLAPQGGTGVADPRKGYRDNARHWLGVAAAIEKETPGGLTEEWKGRLGEAMTDLNKDVYGGAEAIPAADADAGAPPPAAAPPAADQPAK